MICRQCGAEFNEIYSNGRCIVCGWDQQEPEEDDPDALLP